MKKYLIHWLDGGTTEIQGYDIADAFERTGLSEATILSNLDYWIPI